MPESERPARMPESLVLPDPLYARIRDYLLRCRELSDLCTQNGWIDNATLQIDVESRDGGDVRVAVEFTEVIMEGGGCIADRRACFGKLSIQLDRDGNVASCRLI